MEINCINPRASATICSHFVSFEGPNSANTFQITDYGKLYRRHSFDIRHQFSPVRRYFNSNREKSGTSSLKERFHSIYGGLPTTLSTVWNELRFRLKPYTEIKHLVWALIVLKLYATETAPPVLPTERRSAHHRGILSHCVRAYRLYVNKIHPCGFNALIWYPLTALILFRLYFRCFDQNSVPTFPNFWISIDCTNFQIYEMEPFDTKRYSHKFEGPGFRYEIAVSAGTE